MSKFEVQWSEITEIEYKIEIEAVNEDEAEDIWTFMEPDKLEAQKEQICMSYGPDFVLHKVIKISE